MDMTMENCRTFVSVLASDAPAPGGGGAAALQAASLNVFIDRKSTV